jgi:hypothetical protein
MSPKRNLQALTAAILAASPSFVLRPARGPARRDKYQPCDVCRQPCRGGRCGKCQARLPLATPASRGV